MTEILVSEILCEINLILNSRYTRFNLNRVTYSYREFCAVTESYTELHRVSENCVELYKVIVRESYIQLQRVL